MKRNMTLVGMVLLLAWTAAAADMPRMETFLGYDMLRVNSARNIPAYTASGGGGQFVLNFTSWIGVVADLYASHNGNGIGGATINGVNYPGGKIDTTSAFYQFGPRVAIRKWSRFTPFVQMLIGGQTVSGSAQVTLPAGSSVTVVVPGGVAVIPGGTNTSNVALHATSQQTAFSYLMGGGLDIKLSKHVNFRPIGADLQFTRLSQLAAPQTTRSQYSFRYSTGINFTFGGAQ